MSSPERPPACVDCDWTGFRQVLVIDDKARTIWAAPCDCARGRAISHPMVTDAKLPPPPPFHVFADIHRRKGNTVIVTDRHESRIALKDSNPAERLGDRPTEEREAIVRAWLRERRR